MLDRVQKRVGHGRKREVGDRRKGIRRGEMERVSTFIDSMWVLVDQETK